MTQEELTRRIQTIDTDTLKRMSPHGIAVLTDGFKEPLVREIICTQGTNYLQRELWEAVRTAYHQYRSDTVLGKTWGEFPKVEAVYPEFMAQIDFDLECGMVITREGSIQESRPRLKISDFSVVNAKHILKGMTERTSSDADDPELSRLKKENELLKEEIERLKGECEKLDGDLHIAEQRLLEEQKKYSQLEESINKQSACDLDIDEVAVELLTPLFKDNDSQKARNFWEEVKGKDDREVADVVVAYKQVLSEKMRNVAMWRILHSFKTYTSSDRNFDTALRNLHFR